MKDKILISIGVIIAVSIGLIGVNEIKRNFDIKTVNIKKEENKVNKKIEYTSDFNINLIKTVDKEENYLISPYSIKIALNMLREGADNNTLKEIENVIGTRNINDVSIKNRVNIANSLFIKEKYKKYVSNDFNNKIKNNYNGEVLYDEFRTPKVINDWVDKNTNGMIKKILNQMSPNFVLGLANAIAIDVEWQSEFECTNTSSEKFTKLDNKNINVEMMHKSYSSSDYKYLKDDNAVGIILPYRNYNKQTGEIDYTSNTGLEFVGILPNDSVSNYINDLTKEKLNNLLNNYKEASNNLEIHLSLPRFKYEYSLDNFKQVLINMGIKDAFDEFNADFTKMVPKNDELNNIYVEDAIHKTYIDLNEKGTKAAAVTYFGLYNSAAKMPEEKEIINIDFNKPFIYMIRDKQTKEILFFGTVYEPNIWNGSTCSEE